MFYKASCMVDIIQFWVDVYSPIHGDAWVPYSFLFYWKFKHVSWIKLGWKPHVMIVRQVWTYHPVSLDNVSQIPPTLHLLNDWIIVGALKRDAWKIPTILFGAELINFFCKWLPVIMMVIFYFSGNCVGFSWLAVMAELELKNDLPEAKKPLISPKIGTHNGTFHCDEALACFMLKQLPEYRHANIVRTRNPEELAKCDVVVDVGGVYDPEKHRYDHHQRCVN